MMEQMRLELFERHAPGRCDEETRLADIGGGKSFCAVWDRWTNCREVGYCVFEKWEKE